jgi:hypothetical protein
MFVAYGFPDERNPKFNPQTVERERYIEGRFHTFCEQTNNTNEKRKLEKEKWKFISNFSFRHIFLAST